MNEVLRVIRDGNIITLIIRTEGDQDFWHWTLTDYDFKKSLGRNGRKDLLVTFALGNITPKMAEIVANDPENDTVGTSGGSFETVGKAVCDVMGWSEDMAKAIDEE